MSDYGSDFVSVTDEDGNEFELEHLDTIEMEDRIYMAFLPADMDENDDDYGMVILEAIEENGERFSPRLMTRLSSKLSTRGLWSNCLTKNRKQCSYGMQFLLIIQSIVIEMPPPTWYDNHDPALCVIGLFKPTSIIRDAGLYQWIAGLPEAPGRFPDVGSDEAGRR